MKNIEEMTMLEIQQNFNVCPICWSKDHLCGECEQNNDIWEYTHR